MMSAGPKSKGNLFADRFNADLFFATADGLVFYTAFYNREDRKVLAHPDIPPGVDLGAALAYEDISGDHILAGIFLMPNRFDSLSRPLRLEPPPFLCAITASPLRTCVISSVCVR